MTLTNTGQITLKKSESMTGKGRKDLSVYNKTLTLVVPGELKTEDVKERITLLGEQLSEGICKSFRVSAAEMLSHLRTTRTTTNHLK